MKISKINKTAPRFGLHFGEIFVIPSIQKYDFLHIFISFFEPKNIAIYYPQDCKPIIIQILQ